MRNVAVIGAGGIGSRHLQGLARLDVPARIVTVDPNERALETARSRFGEMPPNRDVDVTYARTLDAVGGTIDLAIVATTASVRPAVVGELLARCRVSFLVLEKVLARSTPELDALARAARAPVSGWVNCPRRLFPFYRELRRRLEGAGPLEIEASGGEWALASNSIHVLDLVAFFSGEALVSLDSSGLDRSALPSKRPGFREVTGVLAGEYAGGTRVRIVSRRGDPKATLDWRIATVSGDFEIAIDEGARAVSLLRGVLDKEGDRRPARVEMPLQSELTHLVAQDLFREGACGLVPLDESVSLHRILLDELLALFRELEPDAGYERVPIT